MEELLTNFIQNVQHMLSIIQTDLGSLHPFIIHFPIALLFIVPVVIVLGIFHPKGRNTLNLAALILLWTGVLTSYLSVETGEAASEFINPNSPAIKTLEAHEELAEQSQFIFLFIAGYFTLYALICAMKEKKLKAMFHNVALAIFFLVYLYGIIVLVNAAHQGAKLVHQHGIKSNYFKNTPTQPSSAEIRREITY